MIISQILGFEFFSAYTVKNYAQTSGGSYSYTVVLDTINWRHSYYQRHWWRGARFAFMRRLA